MSDTNIERLKAIAEALDRALGDTDLTHVENDEELRQIAPVQWACSELNKIIQNAAPQGTARTAKPQGAEVNLSSEGLKPNAPADAA